jgi:N-acetylneuraminic acid mutarotase
MVVWGGSLQGGGVTNTGGIFDPTGRSWAESSTANVPSARRLATAVWTGTKMLVWGGIAGGAPLGTGGVFDPVTNTWQTISTNGAPSPRYYHSAVWTGSPDSKMLIWGGFDGTSYLGDGAAYDPGTNTWAPVPGSGSPPSPRREHTATWTGTSMIVWGGYGYDPTLMVDTYFGDGGIYDPSSSTWAPISLAAAPSPRGQHTATWTGTGTEMIVWGGSNGSVLGDGAKYNATGASWTPMNGPFPSARQFHRTVWLGNQMMMWGGTDSSVNVDSGGNYDPVMNKWDAMPTAPAARAHHTAVETGTTMIIWGGQLANGNLTNEGAIFNPAFMP